MSSSYDNMGPRVDLAGDAPHPGPAANQPRPPITPQPPVIPSQRAKGGGGSSVLGIVALVFALLALGVAVYGLYTQPEEIALPPVSPNVVPGATAERVAKMEKDVQDLMLRMVTLGKEIKAVTSKTGSVTKLTQLSNRVAALQDRIDALSVDRKISSLEKKTQSQAGDGQKAEEPKKAEPAPPKKAEPKKTPERSKQVYTVRRGDNLYSVAKRYNVSMRSLKQWNNLKSNTLLVGQKLVIYK